LFTEVTARTEFQDELGNVLDPGLSLDDGENLSVLVHIPVLYRGGPGSTQANGVESQRLAGFGVCDQLVYDVLGGNPVKGSLGLEDAGIVDVEVDDFDGSDRKAFSYKD